MERCPSGSVLIQGLCYFDCPASSLPATEDFTKCVSTVPCGSEVQEVPEGSLAQDPIFSTVCTKVPVPTDVETGTCPEGYTQWQTGLCFVNCPSSLQENGLSCLKMPVLRTYTEPDCPLGPLFVYRHFECVPTATLYAIVIILVLLIVFLFWPT